MKKLVLVALIVVLGLPAAAAAQTSSSGGDWERFYARVEYLLWWTKDSPAPTPLVFPQGNGSQVLLGNHDVGVGSRNGARLTMGYWLTEDRVWGLEFSGFWLTDGNESRSVAGSGSPGEPGLRIPFINAQTGLETSTALSSPSNFAGFASEKLTSQIWGAEANLLAALYSEGPWRVELIGGFRYMKLAEKYSFETSSPDLSGPGVFVTSDVFDATNDFYGGQIGVRARYQGARWMFDATAKAAVGVMHQSIGISGHLFTNQTISSVYNNYVGGYFAQFTNIGQHSRDVVGFVPEARLSAGFRITDWAAIVVGYTFLYAQNVIRPGNQIDRTININGSPSFNASILNQTPPLVGPPRPAVKFEGSDFWAHGLTAGLNLSF